MANTILGRKNWHSNIRLSFDQTCMPELREVLKTTKTEISRKVFNSQNSDLAEKVLNGKDTDMGKILSICNYFGIDICQFIVDEKGRHPKLVFEELQNEQTTDTELMPVEEMPMGRNGKPERYPLDAGAETLIEKPELRIDNPNSASIIDNSRETISKIYSLYERIIELTGENERMKAILSLYDQRGMVVKP